jgi:hypothetical protein
MKWFRILWCAMVLQTMPAQACTRASERPSPGPDPPVLLVLPGASNVQRKTLDGTEAIQYELDFRFPAAGPIDAILRHMAKRGWKPLKKDWLNSDIPTSYVRGWTDYDDRSVTPAVHRYAWSCSWENGKGDVAKYGLLYTHPETGRAPLSRALVYGSIMTAHTVEQVRRQVRELESKSDTRQSPPLSRSPNAMQRTDVKPPEAILLSNHLGEAIVQLLATSGPQVSYRWRRRDAKTGVESAGRAPLSAAIQAGPFRLSWLPESEFPSAVGFHQTEMDLIKLPGDFFEALDLSEIRRLSSLTKDRDELFRSHQPSPSDRNRARRSVFFESGSSLAIQRGHLLFVTGSAGRGVAEFDDVDANRMTYRWRFKDASKRESSGTTRHSPDVPVGSFRIGSYELVWMTRSTRTFQSADRTESDWSAEVRFLPEEVSCFALSGAALSDVDLDHDPTPPR